MKEEKQIERGKRCLRVFSMQAQGRHLKENKYEDPITGWYCDMCTEMVGPWLEAVRAHCSENEPLQKHHTKTIDVDTLRPK